MKNTVLMTAYAVNPYKGSEDGTGWNFIHQASKQNKVIAITRKNNRENIEKYVKEHPEIQSDSIQFYYFDLPYWMRFWKKGTIGALLYFYLWQLFTPVFIIKHKLRFDIAHNLNFHNDWIPTFLWIFGKPLIWGPIGHHPVIPASYVLHAYGYKAFLIDRANDLIKNFVRRLDPFIYIALWKSDIILAVNSTTAQKYPWVKNKIKTFPAIGGMPLENRSKNEQKDFIVFSAGRLEPIKGFDIALLAYNRFCEKLTPQERLSVKFQIAGAGKYQPILTKIAQTNSIPERIQFLSWVPKEEIHTLYQNASVFLFPSHEGAGMVIPEALSYGLPIICFDNPGPGESTDDFSALKAGYSTYAESVETFSNHLLNLFQDKKKRNNMGEAAHLRYEALFNWNKKGELLHQQYIQLTTNYEKKYRIYSPA